jgi:ATP-dependent Clp protease ATP-binding subunit ClpC
MFERYTEDARRVIFFGRYEASQFSSLYIETEHLLLAIAREQPFLLRSLLPLFPYAAELRSEIERIRPPAAGKVSTSVDLPLSNQCKRILAYATEEAERATDFHIRSQHILVAMVREEGSIAAELLKKYGADLKKLREDIAATIPKRAPGAPTMYCHECNQDRPPLTCRHCKVAICHVCGTELLNKGA